MDDASVLIIRVTEGCNAGCFMCSFARLPVNYSFSVADAEELLRQNSSHHFKLVRFTGGEPLLLSQLPAIIALFKSAGLLTSIISNGWYVAERAEELLQAGLDQIILSLDGADAPSHDKFRKTVGLFDRLTSGAREIKRRNPSLNLRVNTVVGPHNIGQLRQIHQILCDLGADQWSIIPLKSPSGAWPYPDREKFLAQYRELKDFLHSADRQGGPILLGYSRAFAGRTEDETEQLLEHKITVRPRATCQLVRKVRYYVPERKQVTVCNCVGHRDVPFPVYAEVDGQRLSSPQLNVIENWFEEHGPQVCTACEPLNAALAEGVIDLEREPLGF